MRRRLAFLVLTATLLAAACDGGAATPLSPEEIVDAFVSITQAEDRTYHLEWQGSIESSVMGERTVSSLIGAVDFSGDDSAAGLRIRMAMPGLGVPGGLPEVVTQVVRIDGATFTRWGATPWQPMPDPPGTLDPLGGLDASKVTYEGAEMLDDLALHRLRVNDPAAALTAMLSPAGAGPELTSSDPESEVFTILVDGAGIPAAAEAALAAEMSMGDLLGDGAEMSFTYAIVFNFQFSDWGADIQILPPN